jgi:hypothetical protein
MNESLAFVRVSPKHYQAVWRHPFRMFVFDIRKHDLRKSVPRFSGARRHRWPWSAEVSWLEDGGKIRWVLPLYGEHTRFRTLEGAQLACGQFAPCVYTVDAERRRM